MVFFLDFPFYGTYPALAIIPEWLVTALIFNMESRIQKIEPYTKAVAPVRSYSFRQSRHKSV